jgi:amino acid permease
MPDRYVCFITLINMFLHCKNIFYNTKTQKHKNIKTQKHKNTKTQKHKNTKTQKHKNTKTQKHKHIYHYN